MDDRALINKLQDSGNIAAMDVALWRDSAGLLAAFDAIGRHGVNALIKIDGARLEGSVYTVVISGGKLGEEFFRKDGKDLVALLREAISFYLDKVRSRSEAT